MGPSSHVLDLFAVPESVEPLEGGQGASVRAGDLVLSPGRDPDVLEWLNPLLARLAVRLDEGPRVRGDVRIAMPVPARDGSWAVEGWGASRWEPGTRACSDLDVVLAAGRLLHARFAVAVPTRPEGLDARRDRWAAAERVAFGEVADDPDPPEGPDGAAAHAGLVTTPPLVGELLQALPVASALGRPQLVHADLLGNVLLDEDDVPVVIDVSPAWRPVRWAEAVTVLDAVVHGGADPARLSAYAHGAAREALLRAAVFRLVSDEEPVDEAAYRRVLAPLL